MPTFTDTELEQIRQATSIVDVVGSFVELKKKGVNYSSCCPFHNEKTPSFVVSQEKGIYKCFGCGEAGDSFQFLMAHESMSFAESVQFLAEKYNITLNEGTEEEKNRLLEIKNTFVKVGLVTSCNRQGEKSEIKSILSRLHFFVEKVENKELL